MKSIQRILFPKKIQTISLDIPPKVSLKIHLIIVSEISSTNFREIPPQDSQNLPLGVEPEIAPEGCLSTDDLSFNPITCSETLLEILLRDYLSKMPICIIGSPFLP